MREKPLKVNAADHATDWSLPSSSAVTMAIVTTQALTSTDLLFSNNKV